MIYGKTYKQETEEYQTLAEEIYNGKKFTAFAWLPIRLDTGQYIWLQRYTYTYLAYKHYRFFQYDPSIVYKTINGN